MDDSTKNLIEIGWPLAALIFGIFFVIMFNKPIRDFIGKITSVTKAGISTDSPPETQSGERREDTVEQMMNIDKSKVREEQEAAILDDLSQNETEGETIKILTRKLASTQLALEYEQVHNVIFTSQIVFLKQLNQVAGAGQSEEFVGNYFEQIKTQKILPESWNLENYLEFLFLKVLITIQDGNYHITARGQDYLIWILKAGRSEIRNL